METRFMKGRLLWQIFMAVCLVVSTMWMTAVPAAALALTGITPNFGPATGGTTVTITGDKMGGPLGTVTFGGTAATGIAQVGSPPSYVCVTPAHAPGAVDVVVTTGGGGGGTATLIGGFTYQAVGPAVTSISPPCGLTDGGSTVTINGSLFIGASAVKFGTVAATSYTVISDTRITAVAPAGTGVVDVNVTTGGVTSSSSSADQFTYLAALTITGISPNTGVSSGGYTVTITGTGFYVSNTTVTIGGVAPTSVAVVSSTSIVCTTPFYVTGGAKDVVVTTPIDSKTVPGGLTITLVVAISSITPQEGKMTGGTAVAINGSFFTGATAVTFGTAPAASYAVSSDTSITAIAPLMTTAGQVHVTVTTPAGTSSTSSRDLFTFLDVPTVASVVPSSGPINGGSVVTINGTNFSSGGTVTFGGIAATGVTFVNSTQMKATTPAHAVGSVDVTVTSIAGTGIKTGGYGYVTVTGISPNWVKLPATAIAVTITGAGFSSGATVTVGGTGATGVTVVSPTSITCTTPTGTLGAKDVVVTNVSGAAVTLTGAFTYIPTTAPTITAISPNWGSSAGGTTITITGTNLWRGATVKIGGIAASLPAATTVTGGTSITCITPAGTETRDVGVTNVDGQIAAFPYSFSYALGGSITSVSDPTSNPTPTATTAVPATTTATSTPAPTSTRSRLNTTTTPPALPAPAIASAPTIITAPGTAAPASATTAPATKVTPAAPVSPAAPATNWGLIGGIIGAIVIVVVVGLVFMLRGKK